ncbi:DNA helicase, partial [Fusarium bulbicola]
MMWLEDFVKAAKFPADRIAVITPYRSNLWHIRAELASSTLLKDVQATAIDSHQGRENDMVVLCLAVDKSTGACFTVQPQRLNVATSRHKLFMVIFG